ncbi:hypothetical protein TCAL_15071 [Tigriopus californicus]|uniref:Uncharacterized protein n=1 Tax=Tigriopus californicus TaxID=6832 RepID=A0A553NMH7_TIGCA|nr:hypothetical protein TCAL_15071 [Tigriopus californicus]
MEASNATVRIEPSEVTNASPNANLNHDNNQAARFHHLLEDANSKAARNLSQVGSVILRLVSSLAQMNLSWGANDPENCEEGQGTDEVGHRANDTGHGADEIGHGADDTGHGADDTGHGADDAREAHENAGIRADKIGHGADDTGLRADENQTWSRRCRL